MQLSTHFADTELGVAGCSPQIIANAVQLCTLLLEPIRAKFGPVNVHDGYRTPEHNQRVGGAADSQHLYLGLNSAADFDSMPTMYRVIFDWIRLSSHLPFDQVILEHNSAGQPRCIHISYNGALTTQRRMALEGMTNGQSGYTHVAVGP
jgi:hypothetical protein